MFSFLSLNQEAFGLDISDFSLKVVKLNPCGRRSLSLRGKKRGRFFDLSSFGEAKIKPGIIRKGEIKKEDELVEIIRKTIKEAKGDKLGTRNAVISLSEEKAFLQVIQMPCLSEEDLKSAIIFEAENYIPLPIEQVYLDYQIVPSPGNHLDHLDVLIAAFPKKIIDSYIDCLKKANINPVILEVESLAISRALIKNETISQPILLIDFGSNRSSFIIFAGCSIMFTFSIPVSSQNFTEAIARTMKIDLVKAEKLKIKYGLDKKETKTGEEVFEALIPALTDLTEQIKKYLDYYQTHAFHQHLSPKSSADIKNLPSEKKKIEKILICGGGAKLKGLTSFLSSQLNVPVKVGNPWVNILSPDLQPREETLIYEKEQSLGYVTALGLALRGVRG